MKKKRERNLTFSETYFKVWLNSVFKNIRLFQLQHKDYFKLYQVIQPVA